MLFRYYSKRNKQNLYHEFGLSGVRINGQMLAKGAIVPRVWTRCAPGARSRTENLAVVNYIQYVMLDINDTPEYPHHYLESQAAFTEVLKKWSPKTAWLLGKRHWESFDR